MTPEQALAEHIKQRSLTSKYLNEMKAKLTRDTNAHYIKQSAEYVNQLKQHCRVVVKKFARLESVPGVIGVSEVNPAIFNDCEKVTDSVLKAKKWKPGQKQTAISSGQANTLISAIDDVLRGL